MTSTVGLSSTAAPATGVGATSLPQTAVPANQQLARNPQLAQTPLGAYADSQYLADAAQLRANVAQQYQDLLQQLGYKDDSGNFVMGSVETNANTQNADLQHSIQQADVQNTRNAQQNGTLFSGIRGDLQAQSEYPYTQQVAQLAAQTPLALQGLYEQAGNLISNYSLQNNQLLAAAAARAAQNIQANPGGGVDPAAAVHGSFVGDSPGGGGLDVTGGASTIGNANLAKAAQAAYAASAPAQANNPNGVYQHGAVL